MAHHEHFDPGSLYSRKWVQDGIRMIEDYFSQNHAWLGIDASRSQRVLDYACGNGTVSRALLTVCPDSTFRGLDSHPAQVQRYNDEAQRLLGDESDRMRAIEGNLTSPPAVLDNAEWYNFDVAVISMALHHVADPVDMLKRLVRRVKQGGVIIVVEFTPVGDASSFMGSTQHDYDEINSRDMIEVTGRQKIWPGFTISSLEAAMTTAGCMNVEIRPHSEPFVIPKEYPDGGEKKLLFAKGVVG